MKEGKKDKKKEGKAKYSSCHSSMELPQYEPIREAG